MAAMIRRPLGVIYKERMAERRIFRDPSSWMKTLYCRTLRRFPGLPLPFRKRRVEARLADGSKVYCRLASSDFGVLFELMTPHRDGDYHRVTRGDLGPMRRIVDLGSNIGLSVRYWQRFWPDAKIVAVEPDSENLEMCRANIAAGPRPENVTVVGACVGATRRQVSLDRSGDAWTIRMTSQGAEGGGGAGVVESQTVPVYTVPDIVAKVSRGPEEPIDLLKMDIEGAEQEIFASDTSWLSHVRNMIVEIHPPYTEEQFVADIGRMPPPTLFERIREVGDIKLFLLSWVRPAEPGQNPGAVRSVAQ